MKYYTCYNINEPQKHAEWKKSDTKGRCGGQGAHDKGLFKQGGPGNPRELRSLGTLDLVSSSEHSPSTQLLEWLWGLGEWSVNISHTPMKWFTSISLNKHHARFDLQRIFHIWEDSLQSPRGTLNIPQLPINYKWPSPGPFHLLRASWQSLFTLWIFTGIPLC